MNDQKQQKKSSIYGTIALVIGILSLFTPRLFLSIALIALAIFTILGLIKDTSKIPSVIALLIGGLIIYGELADSAKSISEYSVEYSVSCKKCDISYTNSTGGMDKVEKVKGDWRVTLTFKGSDFINVSAQNADVNEEITARISVNGRLLEEKTSHGRYQIASVYGMAKNIEGK